MSALAIATRVAAHDALTARREAAYAAGRADAVAGRPYVEESFAEHLRAHYLDGFADGIASVTV